MLENILELVKSNSHNPGLLKAMTFVKGRVKGLAKKTVQQDMPFMSMTSLLTALLTELKTEYVTNQNQKDKRMRFKINQTIDLINNYSEISNLVIKGNPFKRKMK